MDKITNFIKQISGAISTENIIDILIALVIIALFFIASNLISYLIIKLFKLNIKSKKEIKSSAFYKPIRAFIKITGLYIAIMILNVSPELQNSVIKIYKIAIILCAANGFSNIFAPKSKFFNKLKEKTNYSGDKQLNNFVSKVIKAIIYIIAGYLIMLELGYNLGGLFTGLGISSVVIALAAQDIAKNLFGGIAILTDKPFKVGDTIEMGGYYGVVVDISFRSTKIREIDNTIVTIQNSTVASSFIKNWSNINRRRYDVTLNLPLNTPKQKIEKLVNKIRFTLSTNHDIDKDSLQVHFETIEKDGIKILIYLNTIKTDYTEYEYFKDIINLELVKILESENIELAYPGKDIYINRIEEKTTPKNIAKKEIPKETNKTTKDSK